MFEYDEKIYHCYFELAINVISGKWKPNIIWCIAQSNNVLRFNQLKNKIPEITAKVLTKKLRELEQDKILVRKIYSDIPPKVEYSLTEFGLSLLESLESLHAWGKKFVKTNDAVTIKQENCNNY